MIEHIHWNGGYHGNLPMVVFEHENHVEVLKMELHTLVMHQLNFFQGDDKWRLKFQKMAIKLALYYIYRGNIENVKNGKK